MSREHVGLVEIVPLLPIALFILACAWVWERVKNGGRVGGPRA